MNPSRFFLTSVKDDRSTPSRLKTIIKNRGLIYTLRSHCIQIIPITAGIK